MECTESLLHDVTGSLQTTSQPNESNESLLIERLASLRNNAIVKLDNTRTVLNDDALLMMRDNDQLALDEELMHKMDEERSNALTDLQQLVADEQSTHDHEMSQMHDDILYDMNASTEEVIRAFESLHHSNDDSLYDDDYHDDNRDPYRVPHEVTEDDLNENTDTEDGTDEVLDLLRSNQALIALFMRQRETIDVRLRARILRLIRLLHASKGNEDNLFHGDSDDLRQARATVLLDHAADTSFLIAPNAGSELELDFLNHPKVKKELELQLAKIEEHKNMATELWMYFDSGASRSVISTESPIRKHLKSIVPTYGSCSIGNGTPLQYMEKGHVNENLEITVVQDLKYDLFSSVGAAKQGLTSVIDFDMTTGRNNSFTIDKITGNVTPLVERGKGILELPLHIMIPAETCFAYTQAKPTMQTVLPPNIVSMIWHYYDDKSFDRDIMDSNKTEYSLFAFDIIQSLNERERDFLIHARLGHLPRKTILKMIKNGTTGIGQYSGQELCKPCIQAKLRAANHGHEHKRHRQGRPGEHLHSDLAVLSTLDLNGNKYVLSVVDEISHETVIGLLKRKTAEDVCRISKKIDTSTDLSAHRQ
jgi:hypothetical protein